VVEQASRVAEPATAECFVCAKHRQGDAAEGGVIYEDDLLYAGHVHTRGRGSAYRGWLVVEPKRHVGGLGDLTDEEAAALGRLLNRLARVQKVATGADHVYAFVYGDAVAHLHVHLAPRYPQTPSEYWGPRLNQWPDAPRVDPRAMGVLVGQLRQHL
jgi:diadenosine tetraphosphate (Ap4A) HIT family hydrolase